MKINEERVNKTVFVAFIILKSFIREFGSKTLIGCLKAIS